jgi:hypothetical protein
MNPFSKPQENANTNQPDLAFQGEALRASEAKSEKSRRKLPFGKILVAGIIILITILAFGLIAYIMIGQNNTQEITSYEECVAAGYPVMESYPEQCAAPGGYSFTRKLTDEEKRKMSYAEMLGQGKYEGKEYSFEFPIDTFELAYLVCNLAEKEPSLISNSSSANYDDPRKCALAPYLFEVKKVDEIDDLLSDTTCYSVTRKSISIDDQPATSYTAKFIGTNIDKCKEDMTGRYSDTYRYVYVENENQLYLLKWPELIFFDLEPYNQILSTFKFTNTESEETDTSNWKTYTGKEFSINYPPNFTVQEKAISLDDIYKTGTLINFNSENSFGLNILSSTNVNKLNIENALGNGPGFSYVEDCLGDFKPDKFKIDGVDAIGGIVGCGISGEEIDLIWFKGDKIYQAGGRGKDYQTLLKMLSTFQFSK